MSDWIDVMKRKAEALAWEAAHPGERQPGDDDAAVDGAEGDVPDATPPVR